jgi:hypothetical protein
MGFFSISWKVSLLKNSDKKCLAKIAMDLQGQEIVAEQGNAKIPTPYFLYINFLE